MPSDILDNKTEETRLVNFIRQVLPDTDFAKFAVGYFFISGFEVIKHTLSEIKELDLLIGNTSTKETIEQIAEGYQRLEPVQNSLEKINSPTPKTEKTVISTTLKNIRSSLELMDQTDETQELIITLSQLIADGKIKVKIYTKGRLHAKAYIFDYKDKSRYEKGIAVVGSSNLTLSGLADNTELNVIVQGNENHKKLTEWFTDLWKSAKDFDRELMQELKGSWAQEPISPYDIYIKTLYNLVKTTLEEEEKLEPFRFRDIPTLADFQKIAIGQAINKLKNNSGVIIADVVGTGKSYIGSAVLKHFVRAYGRKPLIICPKSLIKMWEDYNDEFELNAKILSTGMLSQDDFNFFSEEYQKRDIVLIDESHNFRNTDNKRYHNSQQFLQTRKEVVLLTATPRNNTAWDVYNQIKLFAQDDTLNLPVNPPNLKDFFKEIEKGNKKLPEILRHLMIRRTRKHILNWYGKTDKEGRKFILIGDIPYYFPERELETIEYSIEKTYLGFYEKLHSLMKELNYARYGLWWYVKSEKQDETPYRELQRAGKNLRGIMKKILFKRFESSVHSFKTTVKNLIDIHSDFHYALSKNLIPAGEDAQKILYEEDIEDDIQAYEELEKVCKKYDIQDFEVEKLNNDLERDLDILKQMHNIVKDIPPENDDKLNEFKKLLKELKKKNKILVFTEYAETAKYLFDNLKDEIKNLEHIDSKTSNRTDIVQRFSPLSNNYTLSKDEKEISVLISTDVLSEGLNLQDASVVINYDLHWNPVRLIQRAGRIDRIGSTYDVIYVYNFLPELELEKHLNLTEKIRKRIKEIHETIGEDNKILDKSEQLNEEAMYAIYEKEKDVFDKYDDMDEMFTFPEAEEIIRNLKVNSPEYFDFISNLQDGKRSAKTCKKYKGYFVFLQAENYQKLYLLDEEGNIITTDLIEILEELKCAKDEPTQEISKDINKIITKIKNDFEEEVKKIYYEKKHTITLNPTQAYIVRELRKFINFFEDEETKKEVGFLEEIFRRDLPSAVMKELSFLRRNRTAGEILLEKLKQIYYEYALDKLFIGTDSSVTKEEIPPVKVIVSECLV